MNYIEYSARAIQVARPLPHENTVVHAALGITSEIGELFTELAKVRANGPDQQTQGRFKLEIGDVAWYINQMLDTLCISFDDLAITYFQMAPHHAAGTSFVEVAGGLLMEMSVCAGHISDHAKRLVLIGKPVPVPEMAHTLARLWGALSTLATLSNLRWDEIFDANIEKLNARYPNQAFSEAGSEAHRDGCEHPADDLLPVPDAPALGSEPEAP